ncbi:hypothetical protein ACPA9J_02060 [Pseudomonas aeruginosa]
MVLSIRGGHPSIGGGCAFRNALAIMRGFPSALAGVRRTMHHLAATAQRRTGRRHRAWTCRAACASSREIFELADPLEVLNLSATPWTACRTTSAAASSQGAVLAPPTTSPNRRRRWIVQLALSMVGFKSNRIEAVPATALPPALRWPIPHRQPDCHAARVNWSPAVAEVDAGRQPPGGLARASWPLCEGLEPPTDRRQPLPAPAGPGWRRCRARPAGLRRQPRCAACRRWPTAVSLRWTWSEPSLDGLIGEGASGVIHRAGRQPAGRTDAHGGAEAVQGRSDQRWHPRQREMAACLGGGAPRN